MPFRDLVGHARLVALLTRAISRDTLPPTLMFVGPSGVGKWRAAVALAQAVNCLEPVESDACGRCRACDRIARGMHVDVIALQPDDRASIKIDVVRDVLGRTGFRPFEGRRRVVLVREADALEPEAQNALLKSLEEPPPGTMFVLTTAMPGALLSTVRSRCMRLRFARLTVAEVSEALVRGHGMSEADARAAAFLADGSIGQALALSDVDLGGLRDLAMRLLRGASGPADTQARLQAARSMVAGLSKSDERQDLATVLRLAASMLRDIEAINAGADARVLANPALTADLSSMAGAFAGDRARGAFGEVDRALRAIERNAGTKVVAEWLAVRM